MFSWLKCARAPQIIVPKIDSNVRRVSARIAMRSLCHLLWLLLLWTNVVVRNDEFRSCNRLNPSVKRPSDAHTLNYYRRGGNAHLIITEQTKMQSNARQHSQSTQHQTQSTKKSSKKRRAASSTRQRHITFVALKIKRHPHSRRQRQAHGIMSAAFHTSPDFDSDVTIRACVCLGDIYGKASRIYTADVSMLFWATWSPLGIESRDSLIAMRQINMGGLARPDYAFWCSAYPILGHRTCDQNMRATKELYVFIRFE